MTLFGYKKLLDIDSHFAHIVVADNLFTRERVLFVDDAKHSSMYLSNHNDTSFKYPHFFYLGFGFNPNIKHVLFAGGGGFSAPKMFLHRYPYLDIDVTEIDPIIIDAAKKYFFIPSKINIINEDARKYIEGTKKKYDLVVLDAYKGNEVPGHLMTIEFYNAVKKHLTNDGLVIFNYITVLEGTGSKPFVREYKTLSTAFPSVFVIPVTGEKSISANVIVIATQVPQTTNIAARPDAIPEPYREYISSYYPPMIDSDAGGILTDSTVTTPIASAKSESH